MNENIDNLEDSFYYKNCGSSVLIISFACYYDVRPKFDWKLLLNNFDIDVLFLRDFSNAWYLMSISGFSEDLVSTVDILNEYASRYRKVYLIGSSMGGYASLLFKYLMSHKNIVSHAFGPQTVLYGDDNRLCWVKNCVERNVIPVITEDLRKYLYLYEVVGSMKDTYIHYSEDSVRDLWHASLIDCENKIPYPEEDHAVARVLNDKGLLVPLLKKILV